MTHTPGDDKQEPPGGRAAERLNEFINQRFPGGVSSPDVSDQPGGDAKHETEEDESTKQTRMQLESLEQRFQQLVETLRQFEMRLTRLEQVVHGIVGSEESKGTSPQDQDNT